MDVFEVVLTRATDDQAVCHRGSQQMSIQGRLKLVPTTDNSGWAARYQSNAADDLL